MIKITKIFILFAILAINIVGNSNCEEEEQYFRFELLCTRGFRHLFRPEFEVYNITLHGVINNNKTGDVIGRYDGIAEKQNNGWFVYRNTQIPVKPGDILYFWEYINSPTLSYSTAIRRYDVPNDAPRIAC